MRHERPPHDVVEVVARNWPGVTARSLVLLGEGQDSVAWEIDSELVIRQSKATDPATRAERVQREAALLALLASRSPLPVPEPVFVDADTGVIALTRLPGVPLNRLPSLSPAIIAPALGAFLAAIHATPLESVRGIVERDAYPLVDRLRDATRDWRAIAGRLSPSQRRAVERFLAEPPPPDPADLLFCHNDLGAEHILVDPHSGTITGVIDWTDAAIADPAGDFARLLRDLGPAALDSAQARYGRPVDDAERARVRFLARCALLEDIAYGLEGGDPIYADAGMAHFGHVFAAE